MYIDYILYQALFTKSQIGLYQQLYSRLGFYGKNSGYSDALLLSYKYIYNICTCMRI